MTKSVTKEAHVTHKKRKNQERTNLQISYFSISSRDKVRHTGNKLTKLHKVLKEIKLNQGNLHETTNEENNTHLNLMIQHQDDRFSSYTNVLKTMDCFKNKL